MSMLKEIVASYMEKVSGLREYVYVTKIAGRNVRVDQRVLCEGCLRTERWGGSVVLMVVDAAFTSIGLNYFTAVVPKVKEFNRKFVESGRIRNLKDCYIYTLFCSLLRLLFNSCNLFTNFWASSLSLKKPSYPEYSGGAFL